MSLSGFSKFLLLASVAVLGGVIWGHTAARQGSQADEECILCHVDSYNRPLRERFIHAPFFERQCAVCHLSGDSGRAAEEESPGGASITGTLVDQSVMWRKQTNYGGTHPSIEQQVLLDGLDSSAAYRFRISVAADRSGPFAGGRWLGLRASELRMNENRIVPITRQNFGDLENDMATLAVNAVGGGTIVVSWDMKRPLVSRLELQKLEGQEIFSADSAPQAADSGQHPQLRSAEDVAITVCYQCHSENDLGTSHPVRLYGGKGVVIPEELPTVDGMLTCVTCHDPHGAAGEMLVRETIKTKLCVACHYAFKNSSPSTMFR